MTRDGAKESLWQSAGADYTPTNAWSRETRYDALIVGGGITGLTTALLLQEQGKRCLLAEAHTLGFGTSGGTTAHLNTVLDAPYDLIRKDFSVEAARTMARGCREAIDLMEGLIAKYGIDCGFSYQPAFIFATDDKQVAALEDLVDGTREAGVQVEWTDGIPVPVPFRKAARVELQAQLHASAYLLGLARAYEELGGVILQHCTVQGATGDDDGISADTVLGTILCSRLIYATHIPPGINLLHFRCAPYRSYAAAVTLKDDAQYPEGLAYDMEEPYHYFRTAEVDGKKYLVAGGFDHKSGHADDTRIPFRALRDYLRQYYAIDSFAFEWSSMYFNSTDGLPYIGRLPGQDNTWVATGFSGNGFTLGSLAAKMICAQITGGECIYTDLLDPARVKPVAGFADFVKENAQVVSDFVSMRFAYEKLSSLADVAPGEAVLAEYEGRKIGLYRDEAGTLHGVNPVCSHARCIVAWNSAEKSWDCPCHGARFAPNGSLLSGPARHSLEPIIWEGIDGD